MKKLSFVALVLGLSMFALPQAKATPFLDLYGGNAGFSNTKTTDDTEGFAAVDYPNSTILNSYVFGLRAGSIKQYDNFSLAIAFDNQFYNVKISPTNSTGAYLFPSNNTDVTTYWDDRQGGFVWQPGVELLAGVPLRHVRLYGGVGLIFPMMFYSFSGQDVDGTIMNNPAGMTMSTGGEVIVGGRWIISKRLNLFVEQRWQKLFSPMVIKNSYSWADSASADVPSYHRDSSFTIDDLQSSRLLIGMGFAWGE